MGARIRPVAVVIQIEAVLDDGEHLTGVQIAPVRLSPQQLATFDLAAQLADLQNHLDARTDA